MSEELLGRAPSGWRYVKLGDIQEPKGIQGGPFGSQLHAEDYVSSGIPLIMPKNIGKNRLLETGRDFVSLEDAERLSTHRVKVGDIVVGRKGDLSRRALIREGEQGGLCGTDCIRIRVAPEIASSVYLSYYLGLDRVADWLHRYDTGSTLPNLNTGNLGLLPVLLASPKEQARIAAVLGALDDKIAVNERIIRCTLALGDAEFVTVERSAASRCALAGLAAEQSLSFGDGYRTKRSEHGKPGLPILRVAEVMDGRIEPDYSDYVAESYRAAMGGKVSQAGDVILTSKGTVGRVATITASDPSFVYSPQLCYFRVSVGSRLSSSYIFFWLRSSDFWQQAETRKSQTDMADYLSLTDIRKLTIPLPTPGSNQQWAPMLNSLLSQISACHQENKALADLRDTLLPKLMSGEIRVRDAEKVVEEVT
jgi:type I restriction enzyme, S subunit